MQERYKRAKKGFSESNARHVDGEGEGWPERRGRDGHR